MPHSFTSALVHFVFSTKQRRRLITPELRDRLWPYLGGIARDNGMKALAVGGVPDHIHMLMSLPSTLAIAKAIQLIKGGSSKWVHETFPMHGEFGWQEGYGTFSIGVSGVTDTIAYINGQEEHRRGKTFEAEFILFLKKHGIEYDERYIGD